MGKDAAKDAGQDARTKTEAPDELKDRPAPAELDSRRVAEDKPIAEKDAGAALSKAQRDGLERLHPDLSPSISKAIKHKQEELGFRVEVKDKDEAALMDMVYKALIKTKGHGVDLDKSYDDKGLHYSGLKQVLKHLPLYTYDAADKMKPGARESRNPFEVLSQLKDLSEFKDFVEKLKAEKLAATGQALSKEDLHLLSPLSAAERQGIRNDYAFLEWFRTKANPETQFVPGVTKTNYQRDLASHEKMLQVKFEKLEEKVGHSASHQITEMLEALMDFKPSPESYLKLAKVGLLTQWDNHDGGVHFKKSPMLESVFNAAEKDLSPEAFKEFMSMTVNYARAVDFRAALTHTAMHNLTPFASPDVSAMRNIMSTLDPVNKAQVLEYVRELMHGDISDELKSRVERRDVFDIDETVTRDDIINPVGETMAALKNLEDRLKFEGFDDRKAFEMLMAKSTEVGVLKRAALLSKDEWDKLEERFQSEKGRSLSEIAQIKNMPKAFAVFFEEMRKSKGNFADYDVVKNILKAATSERRFDLASLSLQLTNQEVRTKFQNDAGSNDSKKTTMKETLDEFEKALPFIPGDGKINAFVKFVRQYYQKEMLEDFFKDGEVSLLTKVRTSSIGSNETGIYSAFANASKEQLEKIRSDSTYAAELRKELISNLSKQDAGIIMSRLLGQEDLTASLLEIRHPNFFTNVDKSDLRYWRVLEERVTEQDLRFWQNNINNPNEMKRLKTDLLSVYTEKQVDDIISSMKAKFGDRRLTLEEIDDKRIGSRPLSEELADARKPQDIARALLRMSPSQMKMFKDVAEGKTPMTAEFAAMQKEVLAVENLLSLHAKRVYKSESDGASKAKALENFCAEQFKAIKEGKPMPIQSDDPKVRTVAMARLSGLVDFGDPYISLMAIQSAFDHVPDLKEKLAADANLKADFQRSLKLAVDTGNAGSVKDFQQVLEGKPLGIEQLIKFASQYPDRREVVFRFATEDEIKRLLSDTKDPKELAWQDEILGPKQHADITKSCLSKGYCDPADMARIATLGVRSFSENHFFDSVLYGPWRFVRPAIPWLHDVPINPAIDAFAKLDRSQVQGSVAEGFRRYQSLLSKDVYEASEVKQRMPAQSAFFQSDYGAREMTLTAFARRDAARTPMWQMVNDYLFRDKNGVQAEQVNTALIKSMKELDDPETGVLKDIKALAGAVPDEAVKQKLLERMSDFEKAMKDYSGAEVALAARMKTMYELLSTAVAVALWYTPIAVLPWTVEGATAARGLAATGELAAATVAREGATEGIVSLAQGAKATAWGADAGSAAIVGKVSMKVQLGLSYWLANSILRENMDSSAQVMALVAFPAIQAKMLLGTHWLPAATLRRFGAQVPVTKLAIPHWLESFEHGLDLTVRAGLVVGPASLYVANRTTEGINYNNGFLTTSGDTATERRKAVARQLGLAMTSKLSEIER